MLSKTSLSCAKVLSGVGEVGSVKPMTPLADPVPLSACDLHSRGDDNAIIFFTRNGKLEQQVFIW